MTLADRHRLATSSSHAPAEPTAPQPGGGGGFGLLGMAAMGIH